MHNFSENTFAQRERIGPLSLANHGIIAADEDTATKVVIHGCHEAIHLRQFDASVAEATVTYHPIALIAKLTGKDEDVDSIEERGMANSPTDRQQNNRETLRLFVMPR